MRSVLPLLLLVSVLGGCRFIQEDFGTVRTWTPNDTSVRPGEVVDIEDLPQAFDDVAVCAEGGVVVIDVLANDVDKQGDIDPSSLALVEEPVFGSLEMGADGLEYTHDGSEGPTDSFSYVVRDLLGHQSGIAIVSLEITPVNDAPVAVDDEAAVARGAVLVIDVLGNDLDPDSDLEEAVLAIVAAPVAGEASVSGGGIEYTHSGGGELVDSFTYTVEDSEGALSNEATVAISIEEI